MVNGEGSSGTAAVQDVAQRKRMAVTMTFSRREMELGSDCHRGGASQSLPLNKMM